VKLAVQTILMCLVALSASSAEPPAVDFRNPKGLSKPNGYSHVVVVNRGKLVIIAGQVGFNSKGEMPADFTSQVKQAFANLGTALQAAGATSSDLVKLNYYVVGLNREKLQVIREARDTFVNLQRPPASTLAGVPMLFREDALIEIEAQAVIP
jgi:2-iminobutanoate/2-iminopropanoate deaminase